MSILLAALTANLFDTHPLVMVVVISMGLAAVAGVFVPHSILGPQRLANDESPRTLGVIALLGLMAWAAAQVLYGSIRQAWFAHHGQAEAPRTFSESELVLVNGFISFSVWITLIVANGILRPGGLRRLGIGLNRLPGGIWRGFIAILIMLPLVLTASFATEWLWDRFHVQHPPEVELLKILKDTSHGWLRAAVVVSAVIVAPLAEETFFRGHVQTILRYTTGQPWLAVLITSGLFAAVHQWWTMPPIFVLAVGLGYLYERTGNLWACIVMHSLFNSASIVLFLWPSIVKPF